MGGYPCSEWRKVVFESPLKAIGIFCFRGTALRLPEKKSTFQKNS